MPKVPKSARPLIYNYPGDWREMWDLGTLSNLFTLSLGHITFTVMYFLSQGPRARPGTAEDPVYPGQLSHQSQTNFNYAQE